MTQFLPGKNDNAHSSVQLIKVGGIIGIGLITFGFFKLASTPIQNTEIKSKSIDLPQLTLPNIQKESIENTDENKPVQSLQREVVREKTQIVILVPRTQAEFDCLQYGGGMGCFANNYTPNTPQYYSQQQQEWINWEAHQKKRQETLRKRAFWNTYWGFNSD